MDSTFSIKSKDDNKIIAKNLSREKVKRFIDEGKINDHDLISKDGSGQWHPASKYKTNRSKGEVGRQEDKPSSSPVKTETVDSASQEEPDLDASSADTEHSADEDELELEDLEGQKQYEIITSFGMFWRKEAVQWVATPKLLGMKKIDDVPIDFHKQIGIYLLYDGREVIYVGRITKRPLGNRLYEHTNDRLSTRWDRFSWFGLLPVSVEGEIGALPDSYTATDLIPALEAILIEALEPRQNRKRGDDLAAVEYIQKIDPTVEKKRFKATLDTLLDKW